MSFQQSDITGSSPKSGAICHSHSHSAPHRGWLGKSFQTNGSRNKFPQISTSYMAEYLLWLSIVILIAYFMASRKIPVTYDDLNYLSYYSRLPEDQSHSILSWWLNEPLWRYYAFLIGRLLEADFAYRLTIFLSVSGLFLSSITMKWHARWIFVVLFFIIESNGSLLYSFAIRQGVALSVFLVLSRLKMGVTLPAIIASMFHSAFLFCIPPAAMADISHSSKISGKYVLVLILTVVVISFAAVPVIQNAIVSIDLGRRSSYQDITSMTPLFFVATFFINVIPMAMMFRINDKISTFMALNLTFSVIAIAANASFARVILTYTALFTVFLLYRLGSKTSWVALAMWVALSFSSVIIADQSEMVSMDTWWGRWSLIFLRAH